jgi:hypothetical protein
VSLDRLELFNVTEVLVSPAYAATGATSQTIEIHQTDGSKFKLICFGNEVTKYLETKE